MTIVDLLALGIGFLVVWSLGALNWWTSVLFGWVAWVGRLGNFCTCHQKPTPEEHGELPQPEPMVTTGTTYMMRQDTRSSGHTLDVDPPPERGPGWTIYQDEGPGS